MRVQPRQQLLEIWESVVRSSWVDGRWVWGGSFGGNSISDAEQLLCLLLPATKLDAFALDRPDQTSERMVRALRRLGTATDIPRVLVDVFTEYFTKYTDADGTPLFAGETYFETEPGAGEPTATQLQLAIVDSFAMSVTVSLATIGFARVFRRSVTREDLRAKIEALENMASVRLSAAMVGLLRSFSVNVFSIDSTAGQNLCELANQRKLPQATVVSQLQRALRETIATLGEVLIGSGSGQIADLERQDRLFECGWSWSIVRNAPQIDTSEKVGDQPEGVAEDRPYLYFTVIALDAIEDLFSERTRLLGLLNEEQQRLTRALQVRWEVTRTYWATVATFGDGRRWPLEDIPWRTSDRTTSDYFTLQVTSLVVKGLERIRGSDADLARVGRVLATLAERARVTSKATADDPNLHLHFPGVRLRLRGSEDVGAEEKEDRPQLIWSVPEFAALLLNRSAGIAALINDAEERSALLDLGDEVWDHLNRRRLDGGLGLGLWDQASRQFPDLDDANQNPSWYYTGRVVSSLVIANQNPSWYYTERVVSSLVAVARVLALQPVRNERLTTQAMDLVREAEQLYDRELLGGGAEGGPQLREQLRLVELTLRRSREIVSTRPGTAVSLTMEVLRLLDRLAAARGDTFSEV
jgi:hypothetical protein